jgi:ParB-like chromosome segregation protein Spo0J
MSIEIRTMPIESLQVAEYNPRVPLNANSRTKLDRSLREFGLVEPLIWNELTNRLVGGHARLEILKSLGVPEVPVSVVRLSESRERALNIILNNREAQGKYDPSKLAQLLGELHSLGELAATGFDESMLRLLNLEPAEQLPTLDEPNRVEVTLAMDPATFEQLASRLDELVREFDVESHVQRRHRLQSP